MQFFPSSYHLISPRSKYSPKHPVLIHPIICTLHQILQIIPFLMKLGLLLGHTANHSSGAGAGFNCSFAVVWAICWTYFPSPLPFSVRGFPRHPDGGGSTDLWNAGKLIPVYTALQPRRQPPSWWNLTTCWLESVKEGTTQKTLA
jgi:hypothetical protein